VDRRTIRPDGKLQKLLDIDGNMQLKYFNMQRYIKHHFIKDEVVAATATA
jgi:chromatin remodeling complex protein RSC6